MNVDIDYNTIRYVLQRILIGCKMSIDNIISEYVPIYITIYRIMNSIKIPTKWAYLSW